MKHTKKVTLLLVSLFFIAQLVGLGVLQSYLEKETYVVDGTTKTNVTWGKLPYDVERPAFEEKTGFLSLFGTILIATALILVIMKFKFFTLWKFWFFLSVWFCLTVAFHAVLPQHQALFLAAVLAGGKILMRQTFLHNFTEVFIYGGLAAVFVPFLTLWTISLLLILISAYDAYAVWKSKHMVSMATFQTKMKLFAGFMIPYGKKHAILGGGDIGFPLIFSGVVLKSFGMVESIIVSLVVSLALLILLIKAEKNKYYPAMPFISLGCFIGLAFVFLLN